MSETMTTVRFDVRSARERFQMTFRQRAAEWGIAAGLFTWGALAIGSTDLFKRPYYIPLAQWGTQFHVSLIAMIIGGVHIVALGVNGLWRPTARYRAACCSLETIFYAFMLLGSTAVDWRAPGAAFHGMLMILSLFSAWWAASDYYKPGYGQRSGSTTGGGGRN